MKKLILSILTFTLFGFGAVAFADDFPLGPGDVLKISVYGNPDLALDTRVNDAGMISYPLVGDIKVGGMSPSDAEKKIADMLKEGDFIRDPHVNLIVTLRESQQVSVLGQVNKPGRFAIDTKHDLTDVLAMAGGVNPEAGDMVTLIRKSDGKTNKQTIDLLEIMRAPGTTKDPELLPGDVVYVERAPHFYIYGEVQKPGSYRLERGMDVVQALSVGGGLSIRGTERGVRIKRRDEKGEVRVIKAKAEEKLQPNDVVEVQESLF